MDPEKILRGKRILIVDDEEDILDFLTEILEVCKIDRASTFEEGKKLLESHYYNAAVLDIMGVRGYELLEIANERGIPELRVIFFPVRAKPPVTKAAQPFIPFDKYVLLFFNGLKDVC